MSRAQLQPFPAEALRWIVASVAPAGRVASVRRLSGGITSTIQRVTVETKTGQRQSVVCRRWTGDLPPDERAAEHVRREAAVLRSLEHVRFVPELIAADPDGDVCGAPALLMTLLPGRLQLTPTDPRRWSEALAGTLAEIHDLDVPAPPFEMWLNTDELAVPSWTTRPALWSHALRLFAAGPPETPIGFLHHDYQQFNVLWSRDRVSGVVDWIWASRGPQDADVAHCRLNLTLLYSPARAEDFRRAYEATTGRTVSPWWDLAGVLNYLPGWGEFLQRQAGRRLRIEFAGMHERVEETLQGILDRM